jgi:hypothetical protein
MKTLAAALSAPAAVGAASQSCSGSLIFSQNMRVAHRKAFGTLNV